MWKAPHSADDESYFNDVFEQDDGVAVEYRVTPWDSWNETYTSAFAGGTPPDIHYDIGVFFAKFAEAGQLLALDQAFGEDEVSMATTGVDQSMLDLASLDGHLYGIPFMQAGVSFVWNKTLFERAGLDPDVPPADWETVAEYAAAINALGPDTYGYGMIDNTTGEMLNFYPSVIVDYGGEFLDGDGKWVLDSPAAVEGLQVLVDMYSNQLMPPFGTFVGHEIDTAFVEGKIGMMLTYSSFLVPQLDPSNEALLTADEIGVGTTPCGPVECKNYGDVGFWSIATDSSHRDAAWELVKSTLTSSDTVTGYSQLTNLFPARADVNPFEGDELLVAFQESQKDYLVVPRLDFDYWSILSPQVELALLGQKSAAAALSDAADEVNAELP